ncbi:TPA: TetR/AcrR family transcriptional regulator [Staphylococcus aureus]|nr:TetR/AcrR family transcriptional regulator [Staphylococcus aureus]HDG8587854.1 TetR/AcrR family transcriptional regulator [Staphylococcus aureus]HDZ3300676.1 TetR/AcrR family transcriptional regulator [Staphylococcus aureus]HDZ3316684.1 TetR/AcrR family transcriptional regulator [Staphylococcus aureus]HDZ3341112.1 TetR/AcrR family transcriptional regulator [Staphylococcus aureus]
MEKQKITQRLIIDTARKLIQETQKPEVSLSKIASSLQVTHAAIYKHFKNKKALWIAVCEDWFTESIIMNIDIDDTQYTDKQLWLHDYLWKFVNAKKSAYNNNPLMFKLNTYYVEKDPYILKEILTPCFIRIEEKMGYKSNDLYKSEAIFSVFSTFTLPMFKDTWNQPDYKLRFEILWDLIKHNV